MINRMNKKYMSFNKKCYAFDMEKVMAFCSTSTNGEKNIETAITYVYDNSIDDNDGIVHEKTIFNPVTKTTVTINKPMSKEVRETKTNCNNNFSNIRYDFVKLLISTIIEMRLYNDGTVMMPEDESDLSLGQKLCFNTLIKENLLVEIKNENA